MVLLIIYYYSKLNISSKNLTVLNENVLGIISKDGKSDEKSGFCLEFQKKV